MKHAEADTTDEVVVIAGRDLTIARPADSEALLGGEAFERDEFMP